MTPTELEPHQLMQRLADFMEAHEIAYRIVGSMASMVYGNLGLRTMWISS